MSGAPYPLAALVILDGWGLSPETHGNAVRQARTPCFDSLWEGCPRTTLEASGRAVGLPAGQMGNSEVGHLNLGAGRTVWQDITRIDNAIEDGSFFCNPALVAALSRPRVHLLGLVSDGGVHSSERHYLALVELAARLGRRGAELVIHAFTDGRDTQPTGGAGYLETLAAACRRAGAGVLGTVVGRYHAMDRDRRWERIGVAVRALVAGEGEAAADPVAAVRARYARGQTDEFLDPIVVPGTPRLAAGDAAVFFNFRADRGRQLSIALGGLDEPGAVPRVPSGPVALATLTRYREDFPFPCAFPPRYLAGTLGEVVSRAGLFQLRVAETEKYAHVTYFFNGGDEKPFEGEERVLVPSPRVATYDLAPEMSAPEVTRRACSELATGRFALCVLNYANPDMVGHTGSLPAAIRAVETVDAGLAQVLEAVRARGGAALVTADHGNCEVMIDPATGGPHTAHTTNPVPLVLVAPGHRGARLAEGGALSGVAPTLCELLGLSPSPEMEARSLILPAAAARPTR